MKLTKQALISLAACAVVVGGASPVLAADPTVGGAATQKAKVGFQASNGDSNVVLPGTDEEVTPDGTTGGGTAGQLMIVTAPLLDFGSQEISAKTKSYPAKAVSYDKTVNGSTTKVYMAPMVQVSDTSGRPDANAAWAVKIKLSELEGADKTKLTGAVVSIKNPKVYNNTLATNNGLVAAPDANGLKYVAAGIDLNSQDTELMSATNGKGNGLTSYVMDTDYVPNKAYTATSTIPSVTLTVPGSTTKTAQEYSATMTITIENTAASQPNPPSGA